MDISQNDSSSVQTILNEETTTERLNEASTITAEDILLTRLQKCGLASEAKMNFGSYLIYVPLITLKLQ